MTQAQQTKPKMTRKTDSQSDRVSQKAAKMGQSVEDVIGQHFENLGTKVTHHQSGGLKENRKSWKKVKIEQASHQ